ncbi:hypothetical protein CKO42_14370 [Lamprobacter modestohalophilus]|uniref:Uncharacterized protein n=1 Tax=Lamprobacter modestohalophilus TaxID=1064514 RepID=A0A9X1B4L4_9GAMM|nr:hypothetical protein [Lamprobacter modestohalophilus]
MFPELLVPDSVWNEIGSLHLVFKVDLLHWDRLANKRLKDKILREGCPFFERSAGLQAGFAA